MGNSLPVRVTCILMVYREGGGQGLTGLGDVYPTSQAMGLNLSEERPCSQAHEALCPAPEPSQSFLSKTTFSSLGREPFLHGLVKVY